MKARKSLAVTVLSGLSVLLVSGCGFQLRGTDLSQADARFRLDECGAPQLGPFREALTDRLSDLGLQEHTAAENVGAQHSYVIRCVYYRAREAADLTADQVRFVQTPIGFELEFEVVDLANGEMLTRQRIIEEQVQRLDRDNLLGSEASIEQLRAQLLQRLVDQVVRSLNVVVQRSSQAASAGVTDAG